MVDVDEPLIHRTENHRRLAAPTVRVAVLVTLLKCKLVTGLQHLDDGFVGLAPAVFRQDLFTNQFVGNLLFLRQVCRTSEAAAVVHRRVDRQTVVASEIVVVLTVAGRDVHQTGTGAVVHKHVPGEQLAGAIAERVVVLKLLQLIPLHRAQNLEVPRPAAFFDDRVEQRHADKQRLLPDANELVVEL